jgi:hypothetical protein
MPVFDIIDWRQPWLDAIGENARLVTRETGWQQDWRHILNRLACGRRLTTHRGLPLQFVAQAALPEGVAYEAFIGATGSVPTRHNLHDFFNGLVWLSFPAIKAQLNALQAREIAGAATSRPASTRGKLRDAATIFDENAALLVVRDEEWANLFRAHRWQELFLERRSDFASHCDVRLFGHALMEKLVAPYKAITAHAWLIVAPPDYWALDKNAGRRERDLWLDGAVSREIATGLARSGFTPLPVSGVPGWWPDQDRCFYDDRTVFRPPRSRPPANSG